MAPRKTPPADAPSGPPATFEDALDRLHVIVEELERGDLTLDESIARYEEGMRLSKRLTQQLEEAEKRIERLVESGGDGAPTTRPLDLEKSEGDDSTDNGELPF